ncbi:GNAT family N-acetyltransferase [Alkalilimnicola sp. S0819]|uniref:GNAT family N-acetyltransferase n=1 Tax=Alkalilimnicola sp. S0819 TaxID=2613922 RepID=UPI00186AA530|nr:GNAT family N-acetyltransferase [Alkalilimnicola sp. S0819]
MSPSLRRAELYDVPVLHAMAGRFLLNRLSPAAIERHGFLVSHLGTEGYRQWLDRAEYFLVLEEEQGLAAFVLAYSRDQVDATDPLGARLLARHSEPFVLIDQVCVLPERSGKGFAGQLYQRVREASGGQAQIAVLVLEPYNGPSVRFHQRLGFSEQFTYTGEDGMLRGVFLRDAVAAAG